MDSKAEALLNGKNLVFLATTMDDGSPQVTPVWGDFEDSHIRINTAEGRLKHKNILRPIGERDDNTNTVGWLAGNIIIIETPQAYNVTDFH